MKKLEDQELIKQSKEGNAEAVEILLSRYKPLLNKVTRGFFLLGSDHEDLMQEAMIGLYKAILSFDASKQTSFKTFATLCVRRNILDAIKKSNAQKHKILNDSVSLSSLSSFEEDDDNAVYISIKEALLDEQLIENENFEEITNKIKQSLSKMEFEVLNEFLKGHSYIFIAEKLEISTKSVDNALNRIKSKLQFLKK